MPQVNFSDSEAGLMIEALCLLLASKHDAYRKSNEAALPFTEHDFGIPKIDALLMKIDGGSIEDANRSNA